MLNEGSSRVAVTKFLSLLRSAPARSRSNRLHRLTPVVSLIRLCLSQLFCRQIIEGTQVSVEDSLSSAGAIVKELVVGHGRSCLGTPAITSPSALLLFLDTSTIRLYGKMGLDSIESDNLSDSGTQWDAVGHSGTQWDTVGHTI